jgi:hypothetical protein
MTSRGNSAVHLSRTNAHKCILGSLQIQVLSATCMQDQLSLVLSTEAEPVFYHISGEMMREKKMRDEVCRSQVRRVISA